MLNVFVAVVRLRCPSRLVTSSALSLLSLAVVAAGMAGCGGKAPSIITQPQGNTNVTILLSTAANDQLSQYYLNFEDLTLTSQSGKIVNMLTTAQNTPVMYNSEFTHLNGNAITLLSASVPDDTYTAATLTVGGANMTCISVNSSDGSLTTSVFAYGQTPQAQVMVNIPSPLVVSGTAMSLSMQLNMAKSYTLDQCVGGNVSDTYTITPTFDLTAAALASPATNATNGKESNVLGQVTAVSGSSFTVALGYAMQIAPTTLPTLAVTVNSSTSYEGVSGSSALTQGMFVEMDLAAQADGSVAATRVAVHDPNAVDVIAGPLLYQATSVPAVELFGQQVEGTDQLGGTAPYDVSKTTYAVTQFSNLSSLPFTPVFDGSTLVPGQTVYATTPAFGTSGSIYNYPLITTMTLLPQTLDGTVTAIDSSGDFNVYTIQLAGYDLFPDMAGQAGGTNLITTPAQVVVYADGSASLAGVADPVAGTTYRFHGLVFNDGGTLRMDSDTISAGVNQ